MNLDDVNLETQEKIPLLFDLVEIFDILFYFIYEIMKK